MLDEKKSPAPSPNETAQSSQPRKELTRDELVHQSAVDVLGKAANWLPNRPSTVISVSTTQQVAGPDEGGYLLTLQYRASPNLTASLTRKALVLHAMELVERISSDPALSDVKIYLLMPHMQTTDKYGTEREQQVAKFLLRKEIADRINWDNMTTDRFEEILRSDGDFRLL